MASVVGMVIFMVWLGRTSTHRPQPRHWLVTRAFLPSISMASTKQTF
jgi:hypothetical protein